MSIHVQVRHNETADCGFRSCAFFRCEIRTVKALADRHEHFALWRARHVQTVTGLPDCPHD